MAYLIDPERPFDDEVRRVAAEQLAEIREAVAEGDVHRARKSVKRLRALLRLTAEAPLRKRRRKDDRALRDLGRSLAGSRDAEVRLATFDRLAPHLGADVEAVEVARAELRADEAEARQALDRDAVTAALDRLERRIRKWRGDPGDGARAVYKEARRAMRLAERTRAAEDLHDWRKQVKYHWHHCELLGAGERAEAVHGVADSLGDEHDLVVLAERLPGVPGLAELVEAERRPLHEQAFDVGETLFSTRPKLAAAQLVARLPVPSGA